MARGREIPGERSPAMTAAEAQRLLTDPTALAEAIGQLPPGAAGVTMVQVITPAGPQVVPADVGTFMLLDGVGKALARITRLLEAMPVEGRRLGVIADEIAEAFERMRPGAGTVEEPTEQHTEN